MNTKQSSLSQKSNSEQRSIESKLLTRKQAAELLQINLSTLFHYTRSGKLKAWGIGNRVYYKLDEIMNEALKPLN
ncbi:MAG: helix-turn-helix domain-containing protein [Cytophagales bacterium]|nr:helix-turn-helix domain-containing protein [Cytophagales bacterium]